MPADRDVQSRETRLTVRHVTREEAEAMSDTWGSWRWLVVDADSPEGVHFQRSMLGIPTGAHYLIGAIKTARKICRCRRHRLVLSPEMTMFEAAKDGLELALNRLRSADAL